MPPNPLNIPGAPNNPDSNVPPVTLTNTPVPPPDFSDDGVIITEDPIVVPDPAPVAAETAPLSIQADPVVSAPSPVPEPAPVSAYVPPATASIPIQEPQTSVAQPLPDIPSTVVPPMSTSQAPIITEQSSGGKGWIGVLVAVVLAIALFGGAAYAYVQGVGPFGKAPYKEESLLSGLLVKLSTIKSANYAISGEIYVADREVNAQPFSVVKPDLGKEEKYDRDLVRVDKIKELALNLRYWTQQYGEVAYPNTLGPVVEDINATGGVYDFELGDYVPFQATDPLTGAAYAYRVTNSGRGYELVATFETQEAVSEIQSSMKTYVSLSADGDTANSSEDVGIKVDGLTVTFTHETTPYFYVPYELPQTFFETLEELTGYIDPTAKFGGTVSAASNWDEQDNPEAKFALDAQGDLGDMTYKVSLEGLVKDAAFYLKVNNFPSIIPVEKGTWFAYTEEEDVADVEEAKKQTVEARNLFRSIAGIADQEGLLYLRSKPEKETLNGQSLYKYDLRIRKDALIPFYEKTLTALKNSEHFNDAAEEEGFLDYLKSEEFSNVFDYLDQNTFITFWVDKKGTPVQLDYLIRVVPPDSVTRLNGKQVMFKSSLKISDINVPVRVDAPANARPFEEMFGGIFGPTGDIPSAPEFIESE